METQPEKTTCTAEFWEDENGAHITVTLPGNRLAYLVASAIERRGARVLATRDNDQDSLLKLSIKK